MRRESLQPRPTCGGQRPSEARGGLRCPLPKKPPTRPASPIPPAGAELCAGKAWPGRAYNSHNAAQTRRGELQLPRGGARRSAYSKRAAESRPGLASKQRPGAGGELAGGRQRARVRDAPGGQRWPPGSRPLPHPLSSTPPDPAAAPVPANTHNHPAPRPPSPRPEPRRGCIVAPGPAAPSATRAPQSPLEGGPRESDEGGRGRKPPREGGGGSAGGKPPAPSMAGTAAEPRGSVCNLQTSRLARLQRTKVTGAARGPHVPREEGPQAAQAWRAGLQPPRRIRKARGSAARAMRAHTRARPGGLAGGCNRGKGVRGRRSTHLQSPPITSFSVFLKCCKEGTF